jgi:hypothetical protein
MLPPLALVWRTRSCLPAEISPFEGERNGNLGVDRSLRPYIAMWVDLIIAAGGLKMIHIANASFIKTLDTAISLC